MRNEFFWAVLARWITVSVSLISGLVSIRLYATHFSPGTVGVIIVALQLIAYLPILDGGFRTSINRHLLATEGSEKDGLLAFGQTLYSWLFGISLVAALALMGSYGLVSSLRHPQETPSGLFFLGLAVAGASSFFSASQTGLLLGLGAQAFSSLLAALNSATNLIALATGLHFGMGIWAFPFSLICGAVAAYATGIALIRRRAPGLPLLTWRTTAAFWDFFHRLRAEAWHAFRSQVSILLLFSADIVLVGLLCSAKDAAIYGLLSRLFGIVRGFLGSFSEAAWPIFARRAEHAGTFVDWLFRSNSWISGLAGGGLVLLSAPFIRWYLGPEWQPSNLLCGIFVLRFLAIASSSPASYHLYGRGDFRTIARCCERETLVACILGVFMGHFWGISGIALAFLLATGAGTFLPLLAAFTDGQKISLGSLFRRIWLRIAGGLVLSLALIQLTTHLMSAALHFKNLR